MSGYTVHLGLMPEHSDANYLDLKWATGGLLKDQGFHLEGDCLSVWCESDNEGDPSLHVTANNGTAEVTWEVVEELRRLLDSTVHGHGYRVMDYAFVTDGDDWSKECRTWLLTERALFR